MILRVQYNTGKYDMVKESLLDKLIASGSIVRFQRSTDWVLVGCDRIRRNGDGYAGLERRSGKKAKPAV